MKHFTIIFLLLIISNLSLSQTINYTYDNLGRVTKVAYPDSCTITYTYDASGNRVSSITKNSCFTMPNPIITVTGKAVLCTGDSVILTSSSNANYSWSTGEKTQKIVVKQPGKYAVTTMYSPTCSKTSDSITITVNPRPKAIITAIGNTVFCSGDSVILKAETSNAYSYRWSTGATSYSIIVKNAGVYKLYITNSYGCIDSTSTSVTVNPLPIAFAGSDNTICDSPNAQIQIGSPPVAGNTYSWSPVTGLSNATISNPIVKPTSTLVYTLLVTNTFGCSASSKVTITKVPLPIVDAGEKIAINVGSSTIIGASPTARGNNPFYYQWTPSLGLNNNTFSNPIASPNTTTTYTVHVTDKYGCIDSSSIYIAVIQTDKKFIVYPNPTNDKISIIGADIQDGTWKLSIITMSGLTILNNIQIQATNKSLFYEFSIKNLVSAIYILRIENDSYRESIQIIKLNRN